MTHSIGDAPAALDLAEPLFVQQSPYLGVFHAVSAFNNASLALYTDSLIGFSNDPSICLPIAAAVIFGRARVPVLFQLRRQLRTPHQWSLHTKLTLSVTGVLLVVGTVFVTASEWTNPALGALHTPGRLLAGFFQAAMPRTAWFNQPRLRPR